LPVAILSQTLGIFKRPKITLNLNHLKLYF
jgi:hypothetical protein